MSDLEKINSIFNAKIDNVKTKEDLQNIKTEFFGKTGQITQQFKTLGSYYVLTALTLVSQEASTALPWLYQSVVY